MNDNYPIKDISTWDKSSLGRADDLIGNFIEPKGLGFCDNFVNYIKKTNGPILLNASCSFYFFGIKVRMP